MIRSWACPECGAEVPTGRLSCGACGALLASVQGRGAAGPSADPTAPVVVEAAALAGPPARGDAPVPEAAEVPATVDVPPPPTAPTYEPVAPPPPPMPPLPGAYLPPSAVMQGLPVNAPAPARTTPASPSASRPPGPESGGSGQGLPSRVPVLELPFAIAPGIGPKLVAAGAGLAVVAFVLPWIPDGGVVIGGSFGSGYFATWGLAAIGNVLPFLLAWVSLVLAVLPNRVPRHVALGLLPVFLGGVFVGYGWTYLIASYGIGIGIWALAGGALLLVAGGSLVLRGDRASG
jgi:hypothetical protein